MIWEEELSDLDHLGILNQVVAIRNPELLYRDISKVHNSIVGHLGVEKTQDRQSNNSRIWKEICK